MEDEDLIQREDMVVTVSHLGYVKRVPLSTYRAQRRGGKGRAGMQPREEDFVARLFVANTHTPVLFFSSRGRVYKEKVWRLPAAAPQARGKALINILPLEQGALVTTVISLSILRHVDASADERAAYLKRASAVRRGLNGVEPEETAPEVEEAQEPAGNDTIELGEQPYVDMSAA